MSDFPAYDRPQMRSGDMYVVLADLSGRYRPGTVLTGAGATAQSAILTSPFHLIRIVDGLMLRWIWYRVLPIEKCFFFQYGERRGRASIRRYLETRLDETSLTPRADPIQPSAFIGMPRKMCTPHAPPIEVITEAYPCK